MGQSTGFPTTIAPGARTLGLEPVLIYPGDFGIDGARKSLPKRVRRMSRRKVKRWLVAEMRNIWNAAAIPQPSGTP